MTHYMHLQIYHLMLGHYHHGLPFSDVNFLTSDVRGHPYTASGDFSDFSSVRPQNRAIKTEIESILSFLAELIMHWYLAQDAFHRTFTLCSKT